MEAICIISRHAVVPLCSQNLDFKCRGIDVLLCSLSDTQACFGFGSGSKASTGTHTHTHTHKHTHNITHPHTPPFCHTPGMTKEVQAALKGVQSPRSLNELLCSTMLHKPITSQHITSFISYMWIALCSQEPAASLSPSLSLSLSDRKSVV